MPVFFCFYLHAGASPEAAHRYNRRGVEKLKAGDFRGAIDDLRAAHRYLPANENIKRNISIAYNNYAFSLRNEGRLREAVWHYGNALQFDRDNPHTHYNLGQAYYMMQNMPKAREHLERAYELAPDLGEVRSLLKRVKGQEPIESGFHRIEAPHFTIAVDRSVPSSSVAAIRSYLEEAYGRVGGLLGHYPRQKTVAVIFPEEHYDELLKGVPPWALAMHDGKVRIPADRLKYTSSDIRRIIYHEFAHVVVHDITRGNCPVWLNEGIAGIAESLVEPKNADLIRRYLDEYGMVPLGNMPNDTLHIENREVMTLLYIASYLVVEYIVQRLGYRGLNRILTKLGQGTDVWSAISIVSGQNMYDFEQDWERHLRMRYGWSGKTFP